MFCDKIWATGKISWLISRRSQEAKAKTTLDDNVKPLKLIEEAAGSNVDVSMSMYY